MISAIIPVYNTDEGCLKRCVKSILAQTYDNYEIIVIDDGSGKSCAAVLDEIEKQDSHIHVWHIPNGGVSCARNFGISVSKGDFICFVDSDDTIEKSFFQMAVDAFETGIDLLCAKTRQVLRNETEENGINMNSKVSCNRTYYLQTIADKEKIIRGTILGDTQDVQGMRPEVWCKMFRRSTLGTLRFQEEVAIGEDQIFMVEYLMKCRAIKILDCFWYNYYFYDNSSMRKKDDKKAEKYINYFNGLQARMDKRIGNQLLPEKAGNILKELIYSYGVNRYSDKALIEEAYYSYRKLKKNKLMKKYLRRIPLHNRTVGRLEAVCCRFGFSRVGIRLISWRIASFFR